MKDPLLPDIDKAKAWKQGKIVWMATWNGRKARIVSGKAVPGWIHEGGNEVKWKVIEGKEWLTSWKPSPVKQRRLPDSEGV